MATLNFSAAFVTTDEKVTKFALNLGYQPMIWVENPLYNPAMSLPTERIVQTPNPVSETEFLCGKVNDHIANYLNHFNAEEIRVTGLDKIKTDTETALSAIKDVLVVTVS